MSNLNPRHPAIGEMDRLDDCGQAASAQGVSGRRGTDQFESQPDEHSDRAPLCVRDSRRRILGNNGDLRAYNAGMAKVAPQPNANGAQRSE